MLQYWFLTKNTCTQQPLARLPNLFSVITVILLINMPIPFKFDACKIFATYLNTANSLGLGSKKCSKHLITPVLHTQQYLFTMQYTNSYGCPVSPLQYILLFDQHFSNS